jgi:topoisomerase-4 subunit A
MEIKGRSSIGNTSQKIPDQGRRGAITWEVGASTIEGKKLWYDAQFGRLSTEEKANFLEHLNRRI